MAPRLPVTGNPENDQLISDSWLALLLGMALDQQVTMEVAFRGPYLIEQRLGALDVDTILATPEDDFVELCVQRPAIHRYGASMARRLYELCGVLADKWDGRAEALWDDGADGAEVLKRLRSLPGFGPDKSRIMLALLAKRFDVRPDGWADAAAPFGDDQPRSVADVADQESLQKVREFKRAAKAAKRAAT